MEVMLGIRNFFVAMAMIHDDIAVAKFHGRKNIANLILRIIGHVFRISWDIEFDMYSSAFFKGTDHDFCWSQKPSNPFKKQGNIHMFQNK